MIILGILGVILLGLFIWHYILVQKTKKKQEAMKRCPYLNGTLDGRRRL
jgi:hypothetical protein